MDDNLELSSETFLSPGRTCATGLNVRGCVGGWVGGCVRGWVRAWVRGCVGACARVCAHTCRYPNPFLQVPRSIARELDHLMGSRWRAEIPFPSS
jgi:hypothetical protein